jgi:enoyl-CoA hydratase/carnithine racemase
MLRSPQLGAMEALAIGLVDEVAPAARHEQRWRDHARSWAELAPLARDAILATMRKVDRRELSAALAEEREAQLACFRSEACRERVAELLGRRRRHREAPSD